MMLIVAHHYVVNSGLMSEGGPIVDDRMSFPSLFYEIFGMWGKTGINCFVMITGYFMCMSRITLRKFVKLVLQIVFYGLVINTVFYVCGYGDVGMKSILRSFLPVQSLTTGFVSCFIMFWLGIPFYNILVRNMDASRHRMLIVWMLTIYTFLQYMLGFGMLTMNYVSWFIVLYMISSYIRIYPHTIYRVQSTVFWGIFMVVAIILSIASVVVTAWFDCPRHVYWLVSDSNALLALLVGVTSFLFFKNLKLGYSRFINAVGASTFGVLLIHANSDAMRQWLWRDMVDCVGHYDAPYFWLYAPSVVAAIFIVCVVLDYIRIHTVEKWVLVYIDRLIDRSSR